MAAKDYKICCGLSNAYIAKVSNRVPHLMLNDRREITESEILMLVDWYVENKSQEKEYKNGVICFESHVQEGKIIEIQLKDKPQGNSATKQ